MVAFNFHKINGFLESRTTLRENEVIRRGIITFLHGIKKNIKPLPRNVYLYTRYDIFKIIPVFPLREEGNDIFVSEFVIRFL